MWPRLRNVGEKSLSFPPPWEPQTPISSLRTPDSYLLFENPRPLSPLWEPQTPFSSLGNLDFLSTCLGIDCLSHSILSIIFLWTRSKDCPIEREKSSDGISSHDSIGSSSMAWGGLLNHLPESCCLFDTVRGSEYFNPKSLHSSTHVAMHSPNP